MNLYWSHFASEMLADIYHYYKTNVNTKVARKIKNEILTATNQLRSYPSSGQIEINLEGLNEGHRYLVKGNYKIIYKEIKEGILITDVFDTRQDPVKINDDTRRP
jgi:toxin ParE1/3/4